MFRQFSAFMVIFTIIFFMNACGNKVVLENREYREGFRVPGVDILFVVDDSNSMISRTTAITGPCENPGDHNFDTSYCYSCDNSDSYVYGSRLCKMSDAAYNFVESYTRENENADFRIAFTGINSDGNINREIGIITKSNSNIRQIMKNAFTDFVKNANSITSDGSSFIERGLTTAASTAYKGYNNESLNGEWYVPNNDLSIIILSDEDDVPTGACGDISSCVSWFRQLKEDYEGARVRFHGIVDQNESCPHVLNSNITKGAARYVEMINETGGVLESICSSSSYDNFFSSVGNNLRSSYKLKVFPDLESLSVVHNGEILTMGVQYTFDTEINSVKFMEGYFPKYGDSLEINYELLRK